MNDKVKKAVGDTGTVVKESAVYSEVCSISQAVAGYLGYGSQNPL